MNELFTEMARKSIEHARDEAVRLRHDYIGTEHLLLGLIRLGEGRAIEVISNLGLDLMDLKASIEEVVQPSGGTKSEESLPLTARAKKTLEVSGQEARALKSKDIDTEHILLALLKDEEGIAAQVLSMFEIDYKEAHEELENIQSGKPSSFRKKRKKSKTPALDHFGRDLTELALRGELEPIVGRDREIRRLTQVLSRRTENNPLVVGESGVGKTALVEGIAQKIVENKVPRTLENRRIVALDMPPIVAGTKYRGQFEERLTQIMLEIQRSKDVIIVIDDLHTIIGDPSNNLIPDASAMFKLAFSRGELQCIGTSTPESYYKHIKKDPVLTRQFQLVVIESPTYDQTVDILKSRRADYEIHHKVEFPDDALVLAVELSELYLPEDYNPAKSLRVVDEAGALMSANRNDEQPDEIVELDKIISNIEISKIQAIRNQKFAKASELRNRLGKIRSERNVAVTIWDRQISREKLIVDSKTIIAAISQLTGTSIANVEARSEIPLLPVRGSTYQENIGVPTFEKRQTESILQESGVMIVPKTGFVLMPHLPEFRGIYDQAILPAMKANRISARIAEDIGEVGSILNQVWHEILSAEVIIADLTGKKSERNI